LKINKIPQKKIKTHKKWHHFWYGKTEGLFGKISSKIYQLFNKNIFHANFNFAEKLGNIFTVENWWVSSNDIGSGRGFPEWKMFLSFKSFKLKRFGFPKLFEILCFILLVEAFFWEGENVTDKSQFLFSLMRECNFFKHPAHPQHLILIW
jgi:hypothetical protein